MQATLSILNTPRFKPFAKYERTSKPKLVKCDMCGFYHENKICPQCSYPRTEHYERPAPIIIG
jgi:ribosomal protein L32